MRLDYLKELGVTGIWLSPFYPSPMADFGYDISNYRDVDPLFGTLADFKQLLAAAHERGIKVLVDIVPNHSSDAHPWFQASRQSCTNIYSDWYIWRDQSGYKNGKPLPPNNWVDVFAGKSAWEWAPERQQFYLHSFHVRQPDLNWANPKVRDAMKDVLRYWLDIGVDGFRVDAVPFLAKDPQFRDDPPNPDYNPTRDSAYGALQHIYSYAQPKAYDYLHELSVVLLEAPYREQARFMVTEGYVSRDDTDIVKEYLKYCRCMDPMVATPFIFEGIARPWGARDWRAFLRDFHAALYKLDPYAVSAYAFSNHDQWRLVTRFGAERARSVALAMLTLPGMIFVYYGEELGMHNVAIPPGRTLDPSAGGGESRDPERTPMQWSADLSGGFSTSADTWLPLAHDYKLHSVQTEKAVPDSFWQLYYTLIQLRRHSPALRHGRLRVRNDTSEELLAFTREYGDEKYSVAINFTAEPIDYTFDSPGHILVSSLSVKPHTTMQLNSHQLKSHEAILIKHV